RAEDDRVERPVETVHDGDLLHAEPGSLEQRSTLVVVHHDVDRDVGVASLRHAAVSPVRAPKLPEETNPREARGNVANTVGVEEGDAAALERRIEQARVRAERGLRANDIRGQANERLPRSCPPVCDATEVWPVAEVGRGERLVDPCRRDVSAAALARRG